ncbi:MAG: sulfite exporter TauE/SafE family protein, partial [Cetobacterium sp.]
MELIELMAIISVGIGIGFSMMGISLAVLYSPFIISVFGGSLGNGIMIFPFLVSDFFMIYKNRKFLNWKIVLKLLPS